MKKVSNSITRKYSIQLKNLTAEWNQAIKNNQFEMARAYEAKISQVYNRLEELGF